MDSIFRQERVFGLGELGEFREFRGLLEFCELGEFDEFGESGALGEFGEFGALMDLASFAGAALGLASLVSLAGLADSDFRRYPQNCSLSLRPAFWQRKVNRRGLFPKLLLQRKRIIFGRKRFC